MEFFKVLSLCHSGQVAQYEGNFEEIAPESIQYQASSPDEKALLEACNQLGFIYLGDDGDILKLQISSESALNSQTLQYKRLHTLEFSSERKRMSVIVVDQDNNKWLYAKGAESVIFGLCSSNSKEMISQTGLHVTEFAKDGLRTLAVAKRLIPEDEYEEFCNDLNQAQSTLDRRKELMEECYKRIECGRWQ